MTNKKILVPNRYQMPTSLSHFLVVAAFFDTMIFKYRKGLNL